MNLQAIQAALREAAVDGWLFYDHHHRDPIAAHILGLDPKAHITRRWYYFIPATGEPRKLVHRIEQSRLISTTGAALVLLSLGAAAQESARTVQYHSQDIIPIRAKVKYTTLIQLPSTEKIMEAATGDKDFWIVDVVGNFCFVHPAKTGISSNLNLRSEERRVGKEC